MEIKITEEVKIGNIILEQGDSIKILNEVLDAGVPYKLYGKTEEYGRMEFEETGLGSTEDNAKKNLSSCQVLGMEDLGPEVYSGRGCRLRSERHRRCRRRRGGRLWCGRRRRGNRCICRKDFHRQRIGEYCKLKVYIL